MVTSIPIASLVEKLQYIAETGDRKLLDRISETVSHEDKQTAWKRLDSSTKERIKKIISGEIAIEPKQRSPYDLVKYDGSKIVIDEDSLDINYKPPFEVTPFTPSIQLPEYESLKRVVLDIETSGLDSSVDRVYCVGLKWSCNGESGYEIITDPDEEKLLKKSIATLKKLNPTILSFHNGFNFDLPFIMERCEIYGIKHPFKRSDYVSKITAASVNGQPIEFQNITWKGVELIDTFHLAGCYDKLSASLPGYGLKDCAIALGGRSERRLELSHTQINQLWLDGNLESIETYLKFDLDDTEFLSNCWIPQVYYQSRVVPLSIQDIATASPAKKWDAILLNHYAEKECRLDNSIDLYSAKKIIKERVTDDPAYNFEGGFVFCNPGLYKNVAKIDFSSLYPSIQLTYGLCTEKDPDRFTLSCLAYLKNERLKFKYSNDGSAKSKGIDLANKVLINGCFGWSGTAGMNFNSMSTGALITAYGRKLIQTVVDEVEKIGGKPINCFTSETLVLTRSGVYPIADLINKETEVLNGDRKWSKVYFRHYGIDRIWNVTFKRGRKEMTVRCTGNHRWKVTKDYRALDKKKPRIEVTTSQMNKGMLVDCLYGDRPEINQDYWNGIAHGIVYGDGNKVKGSNNFNFDLGRAYSVQLCNEKQYLLKYIEKSTDGEVTSITVDDSVCESIKVRFYSHTELKELPEGVSNSYLLGFVRGLIATDGSVSGKDGCVDVSGQKETIAFIDKISPQLGMSVSRINVSNNIGRTTIIRGRECTQKTETHRLFFESCSMKSDDLLRSFHRDKWLARHPDDTSLNPKWRVVSVEETNLTEDVYCCNEPDTHMFVLNGGIVTKNCDTDGLHFSREKSDITDDQLLDRINKLMPEGISIDLEEREISMYVPKAKNYLMIYPSGKIKTKGLFRKRNRSKFQKEFPIEFIKKYLNSPQGANEYYFWWRNSILTRMIPIDYLAIRQKISKSDKRLTEAGLGYPGDITTYYEKKHPFKKKDRYPAAIDSGEEYYIEHYLLELNKLHSELIETIEHKRVYHESVYDLVAGIHQMSLF